MRAAVLALVLFGCACPGGAETDTCGDVEVRCDGRCVSVHHDPDHCGLCGVACDIGDTCVDGLCVARCASPAVDAPQSERIFADPRLEVRDVGRAADGRVIALLNDGGLLDASTVPPTLSPPDLVGGSIQDVDPAPGDELIIGDDIRSLDGTVLATTAGLGPDLRSRAFADLDGDGFAELVASNAIYRRDGDAFVKVRALTNGAQFTCAAAFDVDDDGVDEVVAFDSQQWFELGADSDGWFEHSWADLNIAVPCVSIIDATAEHVRYVGSQAIFTVVRRAGTLAVEADQSVSHGGDAPQQRTSAWIVDGVRLGFVDGVGVADPNNGVIIVADDHALWRRSLVEPTPLVVTTDDHELRFDDLDLVVDGTAVARGTRVVEARGTVFGGLPFGVIDEGPVVAVIDLFDSHRDFSSADTAFVGVRSGGVGGFHDVTLADVDGDGALDLVAQPLLPLLTLTARTVVFLADGDVLSLDGNVAACDFDGDGDAEFVRALDGVVVRGALVGGDFVVDDTLGAGDDATCADLDGDGDLDLQGWRNDGGTLNADDAFRGVTDLDHDGLLESLVCDASDRCALRDDDLDLPLPRETRLVRTGPGRSLWVSTLRFATVAPLRCDE